MGQGHVTSHEGAGTAHPSTLRAPRGKAISGAGAASAGTRVTHDAAATASSACTYPPPQDPYHGHGSSGGSEGSGAASAQKTPQSTASSVLSSTPPPPPSSSTHVAQAVLDAPRHSILDAHYGTKASGGIVGARGDPHRPFVSLALHPGDIDKSAGVPASRSSSGVRPEPEGGNGGVHSSSASAASLHLRPSEQRDATVFAAAEETMTLPTGELDCMASGFLSISDYGFVAEALKTVSVFMLADMGVTDLDHTAAAAAVVEGTASPRASDSMAGPLAPLHPAVTTTTTATAHARTPSLSVPPRRAAGTSATTGSTKPAWAAMRDALVAGKHGVPQPGRQVSLMDATMAMIGGDGSAAAAAMYGLLSSSDSTTPHLFRGAELSREPDGDGGRSTASLTRTGTTSSCAGVSLGTGGSGVGSNVTAEGDALARATPQGTLGETTTTDTTAHTTLTVTEHDLASVGLSPAEAGEGGPGRAATQPSAAAPTLLVSPSGSLPLVGVLPVLSGGDEATAATAAAAALPPGQLPSRLLFPHSPSHPPTGFARAVAVTPSPPPPPPRPLSLSDLNAIAEQDEVLDVYLRTLAKRVRGITSKLRVMKPRSVLRFFLMSALVSAKGSGMATLLPATTSVATRPPGLAEAADAAEAEAEVGAEGGKKAVWILKDEVVLPSMSAAEVRVAQVRSDALAAMGNDLLKFFKNTKAITLRYMLLFANAMPLSINSRLNHDYLLPTAAITESYTGCGVHTRRSKDFFVSLSDRVALLGAHRSFGTPECLLLGITQMSNLASQIMSSFAIGAVLGCTSRWRALHEAGLTSTDDVVDAMERFATAYCTGHDLLMNEAFPALRKQYPNVFIISSYAITEKDGGRPPMMTVTMSTLMKLIFLFAGGLESIRADDRRLLATAMREERVRLGKRLSAPSAPSLHLNSSDPSVHLAPPTTTAAAARAAAAAGAVHSTTATSGAFSPNAHALAALSAGPAGGVAPPSSLPPSLSTDGGAASASSMPRTTTSRTTSPMQSGCLYSGRGQPPPSPSPQSAGSPLSQTGTASNASPRSSHAGATAGRGFRLVCTDTASGETCTVGDDVALAVALQVPSATLLVGMGEVLLSGPLAQHASLEDAVRAARALSRVWRVLFQTAGLLPFGPACPLEMGKWLPLFPLYTLSTDAKRVMLTVYAKSVGQVPLAFGFVQREDTVTSSAQIARALYRADQEKQQQPSPSPAQRDSVSSNAPSALSLGLTVASAKAAATDTPAAATVSHLICPTFTAPLGGAGGRGGGVVGPAHGTPGKAHHSVPAASPRRSADLAKAQRKALYELWARQCADPFLPGVNLTKELCVFALPGGLTMLRPEKLVDRSPALLQQMHLYGDRLTLLVARSRRASLQRTSNAEAGSGHTAATDAAASLPHPPEHGGAAAAEVPDAPMRAGDEVTLRWGEPSRSSTGAFGQRRASTARRSGQHPHAPQPWMPAAALLSAQEFVDPNTPASAGIRHEAPPAAAAAAAAASRTTTAATQDREAGTLKEHLTVSASALPTRAQRAAPTPRRTCSGSTARPSQPQPTQHPFLRLGVQASGGSVTSGPPHDAVQEAGAAMPPPPTRRSRVCLVLRTIDPNYCVVVLDTPNCVAGCMSAVSTAMARASLVGSTAAAAAATTALPSSRRPSTSSVTASVAGCVPSVTGLVLHRRHVAPLAALRSSACAWTNPDFAARLGGVDGEAATHDAPLSASATVTPHDDAAPRGDGTSAEEWVAVPEVLGWLLGQALGNNQTFTLPLPPLAFRILGMADRLELPVEAVPLATADASLLHPDFTNAQLREKLLATLTAMYLRPDPAAPGAAGESPREREGLRSTALPANRTLMDDGCVSGSPAIARRQHNRLKKELGAIVEAVMWSVTASGTDGCVAPGRQFWAAVLRGMQHSPLLDTPLFAQCCARTVRDVLCGPHDHVEDDFTFQASFVLLVVDDTTADAGTAPTSAGGGGGEGYRQFVCKSVLRVLDELPLRERRVLLRFITGHSLRTRRSQMDTLHLVVQRGFSNMPARRATARATRSVMSPSSRLDASPLTTSTAATTATATASADTTRVLGDADSRSHSALTPQVNAAVESVVRTCVDGTVQLLPTGHPGTNTLVIPNYFEALLMGSYRQRVLGAALPPLPHGTPAASTSSGATTPSTPSPLLTAHPLGATVGSSDTALARTVSSAASSAAPGTVRATAAIINSPLGAAAARVAAGSPLGPVFADAELQHAWTQLTESQQETLRRRYRELLRHRLRAALYVDLVSHGDTVAEAWELGPEMGFTPRAGAAPAAAGESPAGGDAVMSSGAFLHRPDGTVVFMERELDDVEGEDDEDEDDDENGSARMRGDADGFVREPDVDDGASEEFDMFLAMTGTELTMDSGALAAFDGEEDAAAAAGAGHSDQASRGDAAHRMSLQSDPLMNGTPSLANSHATQAEASVSDGDLYDYQTAADFHFADEVESAATTTASGGAAIGDDPDDAAEEETPRHVDDDGSADAMTRATRNAPAAAAPHRPATPEPVTVVPKAPPMARLRVEDEAEAVLAEAVTPRSACSSTTHSSARPHAPTTPPHDHGERHRPAAPGRRPTSDLLQATVPMAVAPPRRPSAATTPRNTLLQHGRTTAPGKGTASSLSPRSSGSSSGMTSKPAGGAAAHAASVTPAPPSEAKLRAEIDSCIHDLFPEKGPQA